jgi:hypothetical protein
MTQTAHQVLTRDQILLRFFDAQEESEKMIQKGVNNVSFKTVNEEHLLMFVQGLLVVLDKFLAEIKNVKIHIQPHDWSDQIHRYEQLWSEFRALIIDEILYIEADFEAEVHHRYKVNLQFQDIKDTIKEVLPKCEKWREDILKGIHEEDEDEEEDDE